MITPHRYLNLDKSVINVAAFIIKELSGNRFLKYNELEAKIAFRMKCDIREVFPYAINFLYLLGKLQYHGGALDAFEIYETEQAVLQ
jgi:hypothetical protein